MICVATRCQIGAEFATNNGTIESPYNHPLISRYRTISSDPKAHYGSKLLVAPIEKNYRTLSSRIINTIKATVPLLVAVALLGDFGVEYRDDALVGGGRPQVGHHALPEASKHWFSNLGKVPSFCGTSYMTVYNENATKATNI